MKILSHIYFSSHQLCQLLALAAGTPQQEVCGLLGGQLKRGWAVVNDIYPIENVALDAATTFRLDERQQVRALYQIAARNDVLVGIFHSHPHGPNHPSNSDMALNAYPEVVHCIMFPETTLRKEKFPLSSNCYADREWEVGAWQLLKDARPIEIVVV